jgi:hypothetical protein
MVATDAQTAPVVLISFNRPDATRRTLEQIRAAAPAQLFLIADGPRGGHESDAANCAAVRQELEAVDWRCEVHRRYNETNRGIDATIELGLDWVFTHVEQAIILEDDCLPHQDFFRFGTELLERYRDTEVVWQVSSRAPWVAPEVFGGASYAFGACGPIWGWATWRRAWSAHRTRFPRAHDGPAPPIEAQLDKTRLLTRKGRRYFSDIAADPEGSAFRWDSHWALSTVCERGLAILPRANLVENIGFGEQASNTRAPIRQRGLETLTWPLTHPGQVEANTEIELLVERLAAAYQGRLARFVGSRLAEGPARDAARAVVRAWRKWRMPVK